jgi:hypothetical protein
MKIGLSYSRCIRDIVEGVVNMDDVLVIITRTDFDPNDDKQWSSIWQGYGGGNQTYSSRGIFGGSYPEWAKYNDDDEIKFRNITQHLYKEGKIHQPRKFGANPARRPEIWLEAVLPSSELENNPAVKNAWDKFQTIAKLSSVNLDEKYQ